jgi:hypothetical protein
MKNTKNKKVVSDEYIKSPEELYVLMQKVSSLVLRRFKGLGLEPNDVANEVFLKWLESGGKPKRRRPIYKNKLTKPSTPLVLPIKGGMAHHIVLNDVKNLLKNKSRKLLPVTSLDNFKGIL